MSERRIISYSGVMDHVSAYLPRFGGLIRPEYAAVIGLSDGVRVEGTGRTPAQAASHAVKIAVMVCGMAPADVVASSFDGEWTVSDLRAAWAERLAAEESIARTWIGDDEPPKPVPFRSNRDNFLDVVKAWCDYVRTCLLVKHEPMTLDEFRRAESDWDRPDGSR